MKNKTACGDLLTKNGTKRNRKLCTQFIATDGVAWSVCLLVTFVRPVKRLNRSRWRLDGRIWLAQGTMYWIRSRSPTGMGNFGGSPAHWKTLGVSDMAIYAAKKSITATPGLPADGCDAPDWWISHYIVPPVKNPFLRCGLSSKFFDHLFTLWTTVLIERTRWSRDRLTRVVKSRGRSLNCAVNCRASSGRAENVVLSRSKLDTRCCSCCRRAGVAADTISTNSNADVYVFTRRPDQCWTGQCAIVPWHRRPQPLPNNGAPFGYDTLRMAPLNCCWWHSP